MPDKVAEAKVYQISKSSRLPEKVRMALSGTFLEHLHPQFLKQKLASLSGSLPKGMYHKATHGSFKKGPKPWSQILSPTSVRELPGRPRAGRASPKDKLEYSIGHASHDVLPHNFSLGVDDVIQRLKQLHVTDMMLPLGLTLFVIKSRTVHWSARARRV